MIMEDRFFGDDGYVHWIYYNPDACSGGQFVEMTIDKELLDMAVDVNSDGNGDYCDADDVWAFLEGNCSIMLYDKNDDDFEDVKSMYIHAKKVGTTEETLDWLIDYLAYAK